ncbi:MAG: YncE family protein, partial [Gemmatimonadota bacterium]
HDVSAADVDALAAAIEDGEVIQADGAAAPQSTPGYVYVPNQADATVSVIDAGSREVVETVDLKELGFSSDAKPHDIVAADDGSAWYVSLIGANTVVKFDADNEMVGRATFEVPGMMALPGDGETLWVGRSMSAVNPPQSIGRIRTSEMTSDGVQAERIEVLFPRPHAIATGARGEWVHTASLAVNRIAALAADAETPEIVSVDGPTHTFVQFAVSPDGERLVATGQMTGRLLVFDRTQPAALPRVATVEVGSQPWHPVFTPDGRYVVFGNKKDDTVTIVDAESWEVAATVEHEGLSQPHGAVAGPDGRYVYVSNNNIDGQWTPDGWDGSPSDQPGEGAPGNVAVVDVEAGEVVDVIPVGHDPNGIGFLPAR